jgi:hypothetical protein
MAKINIDGAGGGALDAGILQLENGVAMDATLRKVADQNNTVSPLLLSTALVQTTSTLKITTADNPYIDAEDNSGNNRFTIGRDPSSQIVNVDFASNPTGSTSQVGAIRTYQDGVNLSDIVKFREDGQVTFTERVNVEADSLVTTESCSVIAASTTNANLVIAPNGTGALIASIPDGTATGGNARGNNAVDLQTTRGAATKVASGLNSVILGGYNNISSGELAISGGSGSTASGQWAIALGYQSLANNLMGIAMGREANATADSAIAIGNVNPNANSTSAIAIGTTARAEATSAVALGASSQSALYNQFSTLGFGGIGQASDLKSYRTASLTTGATTVLSLDGTGVTNLIIPSGANRMWNVQVRWVAVVTTITGTATGVTVGDTKVSTDLLAVARRSTITTVGTHTSAGTSVIETIAGSLTAVNIVYSAGPSEQMAITFTGPTFLGGGTVTMQVVAKVELTEVYY